MSKSKILICFIIIFSSIYINIPLAYSVSKIVNINLSSIEESATECIHYSYKEQDGKEECLTENQCRTKGKMPYKINGVGECGVCPPKTHKIKGKDCVELDLSFTEEEVINGFFNELIPIDPKNQIEIKFNHIPARRFLDSHKLEITLKIKEKLAIVLKKYLTTKKDHNVTIENKRKKFPLMYTEKELKKYMPKLISEFILLELESPESKKIKDQLSPLIKKLLHNIPFLNHIKKHVLGSIPSTLPPSFNPKQHKLFDFISLKEKGIIIVDQVTIIPKPNPYSKQKMIPFIKKLIHPYKFDIDFPTSWDKEAIFKITYFTRPADIKPKSKEDICTKDLKDSNKDYYYYINENRCVSAAECNRIRQEENKNVYPQIGTDHTMPLLWCAACEEDKTVNLEDQCVLKTSQCENDLYLYQETCITEKLCQSIGRVNYRLKNGNGFCASKCPETYTTNLEDQCVPKKSYCENDLYLYQETCITEELCQSQGKINYQLENGYGFCESKCPETHITNSKNQCILKKSYCENDLYLHQGICITLNQCQIQGKINYQLENGYGFCESKCPDGLIDTHEIKDGKCILKSGNKKILASSLRKLAQAYEKNKNSFSFYFKSFPRDKYKEHIFLQIKGINFPLLKRDEFESIRSILQKFLLDDSLNIILGILDEDQEIMDQINKNPLFKAVIDRYLPPLPETQPSDFDSNTTFDPTKHNLWQAIYLSELDKTHNLGQTNYRDSWEQIYQREFEATNGITKPTSYTKATMTPYLKKLIKNSPEKWFIEINTAYFRFKYITDRRHVCFPYNYPKGYFALYNGRCITNKQCLDIREKEGKDVYLFFNRDYFNNSPFVCMPCPSEKNPDLTLIEIDKKCLTTATLDEMKTSFINEVKQLSPNQFSISYEPYEPSKESQDPDYEALSKKTIAINMKLAPDLKEIVFRYYDKTHQEINIDGINKLPHNDGPKSVILGLTALFKESIDATSTSADILQEIKNEILGKLPTNPPTGPFDPDIGHQLLDFMILLDPPTSYNPKELKQYLNQYFDKMIITCFRASNDVLQIYLVKN